MTSEALSRRPLEDSIAERVAMAGDYVSALRCSLALLQTHFHAAVAGVRLYNGHDRGGIFSLAVPENRRLAELESLFNTVFERKVPLCHRPDRGTRIGVLTLPEFPALAAPLLRNNHLEASVVVVRHRGLPFDLADLAELDRVLPLLAGTIQDAILQRTMIAGYLKTIEALALALEAKDPYTRGHSNMVCAYATAIAKQVGLSEDEQETIALGAIMHDLGKIGVPDAVLTKPGPLTAQEFEQMKQHPAIGEQILKPLDHAYLDEPRRIVRHHHERLDGRGYPDGLVASEIPAMVRIVTVADAWDAMTSDRPYRPALSYEVAARELLHRSGDMWDPEIVRVHLGIVYPEALGAREEAALVLAA